ncbi:flagellar protein FlgN [Oribacterium sp. oral taxon 102]|uniref:flagellar protein FlgN n=1 Tax=Oribacterium sp. oral taxon 102 TaxID=671214 RepID=UPI0015BE5D71|nr:flagellar protein FlgN [Oribacterium sp. oral taxon 102]NWO21778.1 flagellar protein FlgN [Oribacterium sp. oral taxon 102]
MDTKITADAAQRLQQLYQRLLPVLEELCVLEERIALAAADDRPETLEKLVTEAQPALLSFRGLEKKREMLSQELSIQGRSTAELLSALPDSLREELAPVLTELTRSLRRFRDAKENAERIMQLRLNDLNLRLEGIPIPQSHRDRRV